MNIDAIERVLDKRAGRGASDNSLINWLQGLKKIHKYGHTILNGFIDAIKQTPLNPEKCPDFCCYGTSRENCTLGKETASECKSPS